MSCPEGFLAVLKPAYSSSMQVVEYFKRILGRRCKVGHAGTLDPLGTGVLVLAIGRATKFIPFLDPTKEYVIEVVFGLSTDTDDLDGQPIEVRPRPEISVPRLQEVLMKFLGDIEQVPPAYSAKHYRGYRYYELARSGYKLTPEARTVHIDSIKLRKFIPAEFPRAILEVKCVKGTYMRALARDIGRELGLPATLSFLVRNYAFGFSTEDCIILEELENLDTRTAKLEFLRGKLRSVNDTLGHLSVVVLKDTWVYRVKNGASFTKRAVLTVIENNNINYRVLDKSGRLIAVARSEDGLRFVLERVL